MKAHAVQNRWRSYRQAAAFGGSSTLHKRPMIFGWANVSYHFLVGYRQGATLRFRFTGPLSMERAAISSTPKADSIWLVDLVLIMSNNHSNMPMRPIAVGHCGVKSAVPLID